MWNKSAKLLMVRVKVQKHRKLTIPVPIWVVDEFFEALTDLASVAELVLRQAPDPRDDKARKHLQWVRTISPSGIISALHSIIKDLTKYKGLDVVDVEVGDIQVKVSLK